MMLGANDFGNTKQQEVTSAAIYICSHQTFPSDSFWRFVMGSSALWMKFKVYVQRLYRSWISTCRSFYSRRSIQGNTITKLQQLGETFSVELDYLLQLDAF